MFSLYPVHRRPSAHLMRTFQRSFDDLFRWQEAQYGSSLFEPHIAQIETEDAYELRIDAPGFTEDDINVTVEKGTLSIAGQLRASAPEGYKALRQERACLDFSYQHHLTEEIDPLQVSAALKDGILSIHLPKREEVKPQMIKITTNS